MPGYFQDRCASYHGDATATLACVMKTNLLRLRPTTFSVRILAWMGLISLLPLAIMAGQGYHCARQAVLDSATNHRLTIAAGRASHLADWVAERRSDISMLAADPRLMTPDPGGDPELQATLDRFQRRIPAFEAVVLLDREGRRLAASSVAPDRDEEEEFEEARALLEEDEERAVGAFHLHQDRSVGLHFVQRIGSPGRPPRYLTLALILSPALDPILRSPGGLGRSERVLLLSRDAILVAATPGTVPAERIGRWVAPLRPGASEARNRGAPATLLEEPYRSCEGSAVLAAVAPVEGSEWSVIVEVDRTEALGWLGVLRTRALATALGTAIVVLWLAAHIAGQLAEPLAELARSARQVSEGRRGTRMRDGDTPEAREVGRAFNQMMDDLQAAEARLVRTASLAAMGEMITSIVHEMRNPLSSIRLNLQALEPLARDDPTYRAMAEIAATQVRRLELMLEGLLSYGKPIELEAAPVSARDVVQEVEAALAARMARPDAAISFRDNTGGERVSADRERLVQALSNLVQNAIEACESEDEGEAGADRIRITASRAGTGGLRLVVADRGPGLPAAARDQLFQPFFTTRAQGTGLGLANVRKIVELHGGSVGASNREGGGAFFWMVIPRQEAGTP